MATASGNIGGQQQRTDAEAAAPQAPPDPSASTAVPAPHPVDQRPGIASTREVEQDLTVMSAPARSALSDSAGTGIQRPSAKLSSASGTTSPRLPRLQRYVSMPTFQDRESISAAGISGAEAGLRAHEVEPGQLAQIAVNMLQGQVTRLGGLNLRDIADTSPQGIQQRLVYRSSQVFNQTDMENLAIRSAVDLREEPSACKKAAEHTVATGIAYAPLQLLPDRLKLHVHRSLPVACNLCSDQPSCLYHKRINVFHVDLLPPRMKLQIFVDMPWRIRLKTCVAPLTGKSPQQVMTPAVADPTYLGYAKLYRMMLDLSMRPIARALRVFAQQENLPCIIHCIHGKDRTGLIVALLLLLLGVDEPTVVLDYAKSELELKGGRDKGAVKGVLDDYLVTDEVVASTAQTMEDTLRYLDTQYGGIKPYLRTIGISRSEVQAIRSNLLCSGEGCSLRNMGVLHDEYSDDEEELGSGPTLVSAVKYHLFRPHRGDHGHHHRRKHHDEKAEEAGQAPETVQRMKDEPVSQAATAHAIAARSAEGQ